MFIALSLVLLPISFIVVVVTENLDLFDYIMFTSFICLILGAALEFMDD